MKLKYALLAVVLGAVYALILEFVPDFPISQELFVTLIVYVLVKLGVEVVEKPVARLFKK
jgi:uncharacterized membrane protein YgaE (UPF0421/DUF939 family)